MKHQIKKSILWRRADDEILVLDKKKEKFYRLKGIAVLVWELVDEGKRVKEIITIIKNKYDVEEKRVTNDVNNLLKDWLEKDLICQI